MIDLETLGTGPDTVVVSLGAVLFDPNQLELGPTFYAPLQIQNQLDIGRKVTGDTLKWWIGQSDAAKKLFHEEAQDPAYVLSVFSDWLKQNIPSIRSRKPWGNGATFDISIMESLYKSYNLEVPWNFNSVMDLRTFKRFVGKGKQVPKTIGVNHNALDDAINQANYVIDITLNGVKK